MIELSEIVLYENCAIMPEKNFKVDDLEDYLATLTSFPYSSAQIIKHNLDLTIKITKQENNLEIKQFPVLEAEITLPNYNYCKIRNKEKISNVIQPPFQYFYYFIVDKRWISSEAIELTLRMDTLNSLKSYVSLSEKTMILRQHKDRWHSGDEPGLYLPYIDFYSEGINPILFKKREETLIADGYDSYYFVFRSNPSSPDDVNPPLDLFLCSDTNELVKDTAGEGTTGHIDPRDLGYSDWFFIYGSDADSYGSNAGCKATIKQKCVSDGDVFNSVEFTIASNQVLIINRQTIIYSYISNTGLVPIKTYVPRGVSNFRDIYIEDVYRARIDDSGWSRSHTYAEFLAHYTSTYVVSLPYDPVIHGTGTTVEQIVGSIYDINRTDPQLVKIIKMPYSPVEITRKADGSIVIPNNFEVETSIAGLPALLKCKNSSLLEAFTNRLVFEEDTYSNPWEAFEYQTISDFGHNILRDKKYETKLLNSEFYLQKFVYDSFSYDFRGEILAPAGIDGPIEFACEFSSSTSMNSNMMFRFDLMNFENILLDTQDYTNVLCITRNSEIALYNSEYLNYLRSGFNFDTKTRDRQLTTNLITSGITGVGSAVGIIGGAMISTSATAGASALVAGIGLAISTLASITRTISSTAQADQNIAQKLRQTELQGASVINANEVDILTQFTDGNKAKLVEYKLSSRMEQVIYDLFFYCGYVAGYQGVPNETSRKVFNFVQAEIVFNTLNYNIPAKLLEDYRSKYHDGITIIHHYTLKNKLNVDVRGWDFTQHFENWEALS